MIYKLYQLLSYLAYPFIRLLLLIRVFKGKEDKIRYKEKLGFYSINRPKDKLIWFHAASIGEFNAILPIIQSINHPILVTTVTLTAANIAKNNLPSNAFHQFAPLDSIIIVKRFFKYWQPSLVIWTESELWPNMIALCDKPLLLINARLSQQSFSKWQKIPNFAKFILNKFSLILAQSFETKSLLEALGAKNVQYLGNLKYMANNFAFNEQELEKLKKQIENRVVVMAASTHPGEEEMFAKIHSNLKNKYPELLTIVAPRHPNRATEVLEILKNLNVITRSSSAEVTKNTDILLVDTIGEFGLFFRLTDIVCIGGSWKKIAHSFIEAAKLKNLIIFGSNMSNSREVADEFLNNKAALFALDEEKIQNIVEDYLNNPSKFVSIKGKGEKIVDKMNQVKNKVLEKINPFIDKL